MLHLRLVPELSLIDSPAEQRRIYNDALSSLCRRPSFWVAVSICTVGLGLANGICFALLRPYVRVPGEVIFVITLAIVGVGGLCFVQYVLRRRLQRLVRTRLREMCIPVCIACGYDLRGQHEPRCPECGTPSQAAAPPQEVGGP